MAEVGRLEWLVEVKDVAESKAEAEGMAESVSGVEEEARSADEATHGLSGGLDMAATAMLALGGNSKMVRAMILALNGDVRGLVTRFTGLTGVMRRAKAAQSTLSAAGSRFSTVLGFARNAVALFNMSLKNMLVHLKAVRTQGILAFTSAAIGSMIPSLATMTGMLGRLGGAGKGFALWLYGLIPSMGTLSAKVGTLIAYGKGFIAWLSAGSAGALAFAGAIGAIIGLIGVWALEMLGVFDVVGDLGTWLREALPAWANDAFIMLIGVTVGWLAVLGAVILGFVRGGLSGALETGKEMLNVFAGAWGRMADRVMRWLAGLAIDIMVWFNEQVDTIKGYGGLIKKAGGELIDMFIEGIKNKAAAAEQGIKDVVDGIRDYLPFSPAKKGPLTDIYESGKAFISEMVRGIEDNADAVKEKVKDVVGGVREYLPFSPAKVGPLSDLGDVGGGFTGTIADGIRATKGKVAGAAEGVAAEAAAVGSDMTGAAEGSGSGDSTPTRKVEKTVLKIEQQTIEVGDQTLDLSQLTRVELERLAELISDKQGDKLSQMAGV